MIDKITNIKHKKQKNMQFFQKEYRLTYRKKQQQVIKGLVKGYLQNYKTGIEKTKNVSSGPPIGTGRNNILLNEYYVTVSLLKLLTVNSIVLC